MTAIGGTNAIAGTPPPAGPPVQAPGTGAFADALRRRLGVATGARPATWPTVTLGDMLAGLAPSPASRLPPAALTAAGASGLPGPATAPAGAALAGLPAVAADGSESGHAAVAAAQRYLGVPYRWGGTDPAKGLDCSGLVQRAFGDLGVRLPRVSADQAGAGVAVPSLAEARPGDLVFWRGRGGRPNHIGIYLGEGRMIHAPRRGDVVRVDDVRAAAPDAVRRVL